MRVRKVAYTLVPVKDAERARRFYEGTLGLVRGAEHGPWAEYDLPEGGCILLGPADGVAVTLEVDDLEQSIRELGEKGVRPRGEILETPVCRMVTVDDPDGNAIVLHHLKKRDQRPPSGSDRR